MTPARIGVDAERKRVIEALHELIEALDRRIPDMTRAGEIEIQEQAAELKQRAVRRLQELTRDGASD